MVDGFPDNFEADQTPPVIARMFSRPVATGRLGNYLKKFTVMQSVFSAASRRTISTERLRKEAPRRCAENALHYYPTAFWQRPRPVEGPGLGAMNTGSSPPHPKPVRVGSGARGLRLHPGMTPRDNGAAVIPSGAGQLASAILCADFGLEVGASTSNFLRIAKKPRFGRLRLNSTPNHFMVSKSTPDLVPSSWGEP
jgi:hypothetical protein